MRTRFIIISIIVQLVDIKSYAHNNIGKSIDNNINEKWKKVDKRQYGPDTSSSITVNQVIQLTKGI